MKSVSPKIRRVAAIELDGFVLKEILISVA